MLHEEICGGALTIQEATCQRIVYHCDSCGYDMTKPGTFDEYHDYVDGFCRYCGAEDYRTTGEDTYSVRMFFLNWLFPKMHKK